MTVLNVKTSLPPPRKKDSIAKALEIQKFSVPKIPEVQKYAVPKGLLDQKNAVPNDLIDQLKLAPALCVVVMHLQKICTDVHSRGLAYRSLQRMIAALPKPIRGDVPQMTIDKLAATSYEDVAGLCKQQIKNNKELCSQLYPILSYCDFYPTEDLQVIQAKEIAIVLLTEFVLLSQLIAATGCDDEAISEKSGVHFLPVPSKQVAV